MNLLLDLTLFKAQTSSSYQLLASKQLRPIATRSSNRHLISIHLNAHWKRVKQQFECVAIGGADQWEGTRARDPREKTSSKEGQQPLDVFDIIAIIKREQIRK